MQKLAALVYVLSKQLCSQFPYNGYFPFCNRKKYLLTAFIDFAATQASADALAQQTARVEALQQSFVSLKQRLKQQLEADASSQARGPAFQPVPSATFAATPCQALPVPQHGGLNELQLVVLHIHQLEQQEQRRLETMARGSTDGAWNPQRAQPQLPRDDLLRAKVTGPSSWGRASHPDRSLVMSPHLA